MTGNFRASKTVKLGARRPYWLTLAVLVAMTVAVLLLMPWHPSFPTVSLDVSWQYALNEAVAHKLVFGRDIDFTFGPLYALYAYVYHPDVDAIALIGSFLFGIGFCTGCFLLAFPHRLWHLILLPLLIAQIAVKDSLFITLPFILLVLIGRICVPEGTPFHLRATLWTKTAVIVVACTVAIVPLVKGSFAAATLLPVFLGMYMLVRAMPRFALTVALCGVFAICSGWVLTGQPLIALPEFFVAQAPIISGYSEAMSRQGDVSEIVIYMAVCLPTLILFGWSLYRQIGRRALLLALGLAFAIFMNYKAGFTRHDGHALIAGAALLVLGYCVAPVVGSIQYVLVMFAATAAWLHIDRVYIDPHPDAYTRLRDAVVSTYVGLTDHLFKPHELQAEFDRANQQIRSAVPLPQVTGTVDLYPTELSTVFAHHLNWSGRPILQSYSAYDMRLDAMNVAHLEGPRAPDVVFFALAPIDDKLPSLDDAGSLPQLLARYEIIAYQPPYIQMKRRAATLAAPVASSRLVMHTTARLNQPIPVSVQGPLWAVVDVRPTFLGRVVSALYKAPPVEIALTLSNDRVVRHRFVPRLGQSGFVLSPYMADAGDFLRLAAGVGAASSVKSFTIVSQNTSLWNGHFEVYLSSLPVERQQKTRAMVLTEATTPPTYVEHPTGSRLPECHVDMVSERTLLSDSIPYASDGTLNMIGWTAISTKQGVGPDETWVVLTAKDGIRRFYRAKGGGRADVAQALGFPQMKRPGYEVTLDLGNEVEGQRLNIVVAADGVGYDCGLERPLVPATP